MTNIMSNGMVLTDDELRALPIEVMIDWLDMWDEATKPVPGDEPEWMDDPYVMPVFDARFSTEDACEDFMYDLEEDCLPGYDETDMEN